MADREKIKISLKTAIIVICIIIALAIVTIICFCKFINNEKSSNIVAKSNKVAESTNSTQESEKEIYYGESEEKNKETFNGDYIYDKEIQSVSI